MTIAESLKRFRLSRGFTQKQIAERLGMKQQAYQLYESKTVPLASFVIKMALEFDVSADYLLGLSDSPSDEKKSVEESATDLEFLYSKIAFLETKLDRVSFALEKQGII